MTDLHETYMHRCLELAANGLGKVAPNPMVGSVIVHNGQIIGEGFHTAYGKSHAEVEAINMVEDQSLLSQSTIYVNLEPCNHHGKTPPCTSLILEKGIGRVVIAQSDPNSLAGGGINLMRSKGVEVITGVLEEEARWLNRRFNTYHQQKRPFLILKWAQTVDGYVDTMRGDTAAQKPSWITDETCRRLVHKWRSEEQAILAGSNTILLDNPQLNVRAWAGKDPLRITIDRSNRLNSGHAAEDYSLMPLRFLDGKIPTLVYTHEDLSDRENLEFIRLMPEEPVWQQVTQDLYRRKIQSLFIEGGPTLFQSLIQEDLWDEARVFIGPGWFGTGVPAPDFPYQPEDQGEVGNSRLLQFYRHRHSQGV